MYLKELNMKRIAKLTCYCCDGAGIYSGYAEDDGLAIICRECNGRGYTRLKLNKSVQLVQDENTGVVYKVKDGIIVDSGTLFTKLQRKDNIKYVIYGTGRYMTTDFLLQDGVTKDELVEYKDFLKGKYPLPMEKYTCPRYISQAYSSHDIFDNRCEIGPQTNCSKYGKKTCWNKFYGDAKTVEEKQKVLKKID